MVKRFEADLHQLRYPPMLSGLKSGLHRSCVDHAEGLEFGREQNEVPWILDRWHSWIMMSKMKYNMSWCEWNWLFGKIPGEGAFGMSFSEEKCSKLKCSKSLQLIAKEIFSFSHAKKHSHLVKGRKHTDTFTRFVRIGAGGRRLLQWHFHCGSGYFSSWDMCLHVPWFVMGFVNGSNEQLPSEFYGTSTGNTIFELWTP